MTGHAQDRPVRGRAPIPTTPELRIAAPKPPPATTGSAIDVWVALLGWVNTEGATS